MNRWATCVLLARVLPSQLVSLAQEPGKEPVQGLTPIQPRPRPATEVIAAWEKSGAVFGSIWMSESQRGNRYLQFRVEPAGRTTTAQKTVGAVLPAFRFAVFPTGKLSALPPPEVPFGLQLEAPGVTDARLKELAGLEQLRILNLFRCTKVTDAGLKELAALKQLQSLNLEAVGITDTGLMSLAGLKQLQSLDLGWTSVTDAGLKELAGLEQLQSLNLRITRVTDAGLKELAGLKHLQALTLYGTRVTYAGGQEFQKAFPQVRAIGY